MTRQKRIRFRCYWCGEDKYSIPIHVGTDIMSGLMRNLLSCKKCHDATDSCGGDEDYEWRDGLLVKKNKEGL